MTVRSEDEYLNSLIDATPDVIFAQDAGGTIRMANRATCQILGGEPSEIVGRLHRDISPHKADVARLEEQIRAVLETGLPSTSEQIVLHPLTGARLWFETRIFPLWPPDGSEPQGLVVGTDLTERRRAEEALKASQLEILIRLAQAAELRDDETGQHTRRVGRLSEKIARTMGLDEMEVTLIGQAAPLHDLGKIGIPDAILLKPSALTPDEYELMKTHTLIGGNLLAGSSSDLMGLAEKIALYHHERWDGTGYPFALVAEECPTAARIVSVADAVDALAHDRPYRSACSMQNVIAEVHANRGTRFDPIATDACLEIISMGTGREGWA